MNIKDKTIFDFCTDKEILCFITNKKSPSQSLYVKESDRENQLFDLYKVAYITDHSQLNEALLKEQPVLIDWDEDVVEFAQNYNLNNRR